MLNPLYASSVVIDNGTTTVALVSCDLGIIQRDTVAYIRDQIQQKTGIPGPQTCIITTHSHTYPNRGIESIFASPDEQAIRQIADRIVVSVVSPASRRCRPAWAAARAA